eukprot:38587-Pyramimonas_sp.AAC.1
MTRPPEVPTHSRGPVFHPESFFDGPQAWSGPPEAENCEKLPVVIFAMTRGVWARKSPPSHL